MWKPHQEHEINQALIRLNDVLCMYERATGRQSVLILREQGGWEHRSVSGKPDVPNDIPDTMLMAIITKDEGSGGF